MTSDTPIKLPFELKNRSIELSSTITDNYVSINNTDYFADLLDHNYKHNKGAHSFVFALYDAQSFDEDSVPVNAIKISNVPDILIKDKLKVTKQNRPFYTEIECLEKCHNEHTNHVVDIYYSGLFKADTTYTNKNGIKVKKTLIYPFYVMDYAACDLRKYMEENRNNLTYEQKVNLCLQLAKGLQELNSKGYYHRDLKPDNIFIFGDNDWKIGDLGMVATRDKDNYNGNISIIGPKGWLSPEPMNKYLTQSKHPSINCDIDTQSDIFQLGKIFWYIMQGNVPIGVIHRKDYIEGHKAMYNIITHMIQYDKSKRVSNMQEEVIDKLNNILTSLL